MAGFRLGQGPLWIVAGHREPGILPVFAVPDVDATLATLALDGWEPESGPVEVPDRPCYPFCDPSGTWIAVVGEVWPWAHLRNDAPEGHGRP